MANGFLRPVGLKRPMLYLAELQAQSFQDVNPFTSTRYLTVFGFAVFIDVNGATCGYGLGVMISASQADDSGSIPGSRTILHSFLNPKTINRVPAIQSFVH